MKKRLLSLALVAGLAASLLAGCGSSGTEAASDNTNATATSADSEAADAESATTVDFGGTEIKIKMIDVGCVLDDADRIEEAINEYTSEHLGLTVDIEWIGIGEYGTQLNLMFSSQESCDIVMCTPMLSYTAMKNQNELTDISEYLEQYGQAILANDTFLGAYTDGDGVYGIPTNRDKSGFFYVDMQKDILDELGLTEKAESMTTWAEFYEILDAVAEAYPDINLIHAAAANNCSCFQVATYTTASDDWSDASALDNLGDSYNLIYVDENGNVASYYQSDIFAADVARSTEIFSLGYYNLDAATNTDDTSVALKNGDFCAIGGGESDNQASKTASTGSEILSVVISESVVTEYTATIWGFVVPITSENPDAAVAFMNELYSSSELANLFVWGQEGIDYEVNEDGYATYVSGTDSSSYHTQTWLTGNALLLTPWEGSLSVEEQTTLIENTETSQYIGFTLDTTDLENTITACVNVVNEYYSALVVGAASDPDAMIAEMSERLDAAGINDLVAAYQEQLDAWLANQ